MGKACNVGAYLAAVEDVSQLGMQLLCSVKKKRECSIGKTLFIYQQVESDSLINVVLAERMNEYIDSAYCSKPMQVAYCNRQSQINKSILLTALVRNKQIGA
jgi:hypothetical protein